MKEVKAPRAYRLKHPAVFLAGSIEMGKAIHWQKDVCRVLRDLDVLVLNPRRDKWNAKWIQRISNKGFRTQVEWELDALERADIVLFYFAPDTMSPISLLELGICKDKKVIVCCPDGFWRKGNIEIVCKRFHIPLFQTMDEAVDRLKKEMARSHPSLRGS